MAYRDLREFIRALEKQRELKRVAIEVDPALEITEFADRAVKPAARRCCSKSRKAIARRC